MPRSLEETEARTESGTAADGRGPSPAAPLRVGASLGRYELVERLGEGAMGSVYAAHDPLLDRRVAIKVLHPHRISARGIERMQREARALARLNHPNVVTLNDVGRSGDLVYLAMELIDGQTLGAWLKDAPPDWRATLQVMLEAGRGLAAAHDAGLVHRDFKPDNVMLARDGRVLLTDFGIAMTVNETVAEPTSEPAERSVLDAEGGSARLTQTGAMLGTPRYMAPEQFLELDADPRTDQWAFCAVTWEALFGEHPVPGDSLGELAVSVTSGVHRAPPTVHSVPQSIVEALRKGLAVEREDRHASMSELLACLSPDRGRRRRWWALAVGLATVAGVVALWPKPTVEVAGCDAGAHMAEVWSRDRAESIARAFDSTSVPLGASTKDIVIDGLDAYGRRWTETYERVCADRTDEPSSSEDRDERLSCLNDRLESLSHLVVALEELNDAAVPHAADAVLGLAEVETCLEPDDEDVDDFRPPTDPALRRQVEKVLQQLGEAEALRSLGRYEDALATAQRAHEQASAIDHPPLRVRSELTLGISQRDVAVDGHGRQSLERAFELAVAEGLDRGAASAALKLATLHIAHRNRAEARRWIRHADAAIRRLPGAARLQLDLQFATAQLCDTEEDLDRCRELRQGVFDAAVEAYGAHSLPVARAHALLGQLDEVRSQYEPALAHYEAARELYVSLLGSDHPRVAELLGNIQGVHRALGDLEQAHRIAEIVLPKLEAAYGKDHPNVFDALAQEAAVLASEGESEIALQYFERALEGFTRVYGSDHPRVSACLGNRSIVLNILGQHERAIADLRHALRIAESSYDPQSVEIAVLLDNLGHSLVEGGRPDEAVPLHERALEIWEVQAPGLPSLGISLTDHGRALLTSGRPDEAAKSLERALAIFESQTIDPAEQARATFLLARALDASGQDPPRARQLAERARDLYEHVQGQAHTTDLETIDAWLAAR